MTVPTKLKPSVLCTLVAVVSTAVAGVGLVANAHPDLEVGCLIVAAAANAAAPYLASIGD